MPPADCFSIILGAIAQFEIEIRAERQLDGIVKARKKGVKFGAQRKVSHEQIENLRQKRTEGG
jgi:DNA invertase Pin-like site-specific DNA recombinase